MRLASHGLDPTAPLSVVTKTVTLVEAVPAPVPPEPIAESSDGHVKVMALTPAEARPNGTLTVSGSGLERDNGTGGGVSMVQAEVGDALLLAEITGQSADALTLAFGSGTGIPSGTHEGTLNLAYSPDGTNMESVEMPISVIVP